jgi:hypothetical protein
VLSYFSLTTITTAGFGDVTPASDPARALAMVEAIAGQFYIAVLVAELIGKKLSPPTPPAQTPPPYPTTTPPQPAGSEQPDRSPDRPGQSAGNR